MSDAQQLREPDPTQRPARLALYLGLGLLLVGGIAMWRGYWGAAHNPIVEAQIPFLISGGLGGLALMLLGGVSIAAGAVLRVAGEIRTELRSVRDASSRVSRLTSSVPASPLPDPALATMPVSATNGHVLVSSGGASFHRSDCRLVERAEAVEKVPRADASAQGLHPCRVCNP